MRFINVRDRFVFRIRIILVNGAPVFPCKSLIFLSSRFTRFCEGYDEVAVVTPFPVNILSSFRRYPGNDPQISLFGGLGDDWVTTFNLTMKGKYLSVWPGHQTDTSVSTE